MDEVSPILQQLSLINARYPLTRKYVFIRRPQFGMAIREALARQEGGCVGWTCRTPQQFAKEKGEVALRARGLKPLSAAGSHVLAARALQDLSDVQRKTLMPGGEGLRAGVLQALGRLFETLRENRVTPEQYRHIVRPESKLDASKAAAYAQYVKLLGELQLYDTADLFREATRQIEEHAAGEPFVVAAFDTVPLPEGAARLVEALRARAEDFYRIGAPAGLGEKECRTVAPQSVAVRFSEAPYPLKMEPNGALESAEFWEAVGAENEVRGVFREILEQEIRLDEVELAYTSSEPYLTLIESVAERAGIPISSSTGRPAAATRSGQALLGFWEWMAEGYEASVLIRLLRGGFIRIDRAQPSRNGEEGVEKDDAWLSTSRAATLLASLRYEPGREGYAKAFAARCKELEDEIERSRQYAGENDGYVQGREKKLRQMRRLQTLVDELLALAPQGKTSLAQMAAQGLSFLNQFGPLDPKTARVKQPDDSVDKVAWRLLTGRLEELMSAPVSFEASAQALARLLQDEVRQQYVRAWHERPGSVHVVPLESAGYTGRPNLFVVGLDADAMDDRTADLFLSDDERERLANAVGLRLPRDCHRARAVAWRARRAISRHRGQKVFTVRTFDVQRGEPLFPSAFWFRLREQALCSEQDDADRVLGYVRAPEEAKALWLDDLEAWTAVASGEEAYDLVAALETSYPWCARGAEAARQRASEGYTAYDGLLQDGPYPELDILDTGKEPISASRLEMLADAPYIYFLKYVLGVRPLEEPALEEEGWINHRQRGTILHDTFEAFMRALDGRAPTLDDEGLLQEKLQEQLDAFRQKLAPPSEAVAYATGRTLWADAKTFLRAEAHRTEHFEPCGFEVGLNVAPYRRRSEDDHAGPLTIELGEGCCISLRGWIDRVERYPDGSYGIWDYKTGSSDKYDETDLLQGGKRKHIHLQWALYAYALEAAWGVQVRRSGYFFTRRKEAGARFAANPSRYRKDVAQILQQLSEVACSGSFAINPDGRYWDYGDYDRICPNTSARKKQLKGNNTQLKHTEFPDNRPRPLHLLD